MLDHRTIADALTVEIEKIKGSRFIAHALPVKTEAAARAAILDVQQSWPNASHHCWAFRLRDDAGLVSDDGEPRGSAGPPILRRIEGQALHGVLVIVVRWFGGTKLGVGGLIRAYGGAAAAVLAQAQIVEVQATAEVAVTFDYADTGAVQAAITAATGLVLATEYGAMTKFIVQVPAENEMQLRQALVDRTAGRAVIDPLEV